MNLAELAQEVGDLGCPHCGRVVLAGPACCAQAAADSAVYMKERNDEFVRKRRQAKAQRRLEKRALYEARKS